MARSERIEIRLSPEEKAQWNEAAAREERKVGDFVRLTVNASLRGQRSPVGVWDLQEREPDIIPPSAWVSETQVIDPPPEGLSAGGDSERDERVVDLEDFATTMSRFGASPPQEPEAGDDLAVEGSGLPDLASAASLCPSRAFHLKGRYCKVCQEVPE